LNREPELKWPLKSTKGTKTMSKISRENNSESRVKNFPEHLFVLLVPFCGHFVYRA